MVIAAIPREASFWNYPLSQPSADQQNHVVYTYKNERGETEHEISICSRRTERSV